MRRLLYDRKGNVAILFALALLPVVGAMGAAVDYSSANAYRTQIQKALDSTALALTKVVPVTQQELDARGQEFFFANLGSVPQLSGVKLTITPASGIMLIEATALYRPALVNVLGITQFPLSAKAEARWGNTRLRVALVLDVTGSMASAGKLSAMKTATVNLLNQLQNAATVNSDVYVSIVPFNKDVAVATSNYTANWILWDDGVTTADTSWDALNGTCSKSSYTTRSTCIKQGTCSKSQYTTASTCTSHNGTWTAATWTPKAHSTWNGCITDRNQNYDTNNTAPTTGTTGTLFPAEQYASCDSSMAVTSLTYDWTALTNKVNSLTAQGNTNQAIGLQLGWQTLTSAPFTIPSFDPDYKYKQAIILLSDGLNTQDRWYTSASQIDARQSITCANVKAAGITLYTVQVNTGGDPTSTVLKNCATDASKFFMLTSGSQIITTFSQIATELSNLRLSQ